MRKIDIDEYKNIVVHILEIIDGICRDNYMNYSLAYGTLLGAVRHNGFIPWDDDADIVLFREDYIKLREIINNGNYGICFIDITTDINTIFPYGKICDKRTHLKEKNFRQVNNYGAFVDVFPLDYLPANEVKRKRLCNRYRKEMKMITHSSRTGYEKSDSAILNIKRFCAFHIGQFLNTSKMIVRMDNAFLELNKTKTDFVGIPWDCHEDGFAKSIFEELIEHEFEGKRFFIPANFDYVLKKMYGDYMKLPPENERINPHQLNCFIDE